MVGVILFIFIGVWIIFGFILFLMKINGVDVYE